MKQPSKHPAPPEKTLRGQDKKRDAEVERSLRTIYEEEEGKLPDLTKLDKVRSRRWVVIVAAVSVIFIVLTLAAWAGFMFFKSFNGFSGKGLTLSVEGPEQITLGQEATYFINYENPLSEPLAAVQMRVNFPSDFVRTDATPVPTESGLVWNLGALAAEERGTITIRGKFTGALGTLTAVQAMATYRPANYSSDFEAMATKKISYNSTVIEGWIQVPEKAVPGDHVAIIYHLKNTGQDNMAKLEAHITLPDKFTADAITVGTPVLEGRVFRKTIDLLASGSSTDIGVTGVFAAGSGGDAKVSAEVGNLGLDGSFQPAQRADATFPVLAGDLSLKLVVNGSDQPERSVAFGDTLQTAIGYENTANEALKNVTFKLQLDPVNLNDQTKVVDKLMLIDWQHVASDSSSTVQGNQIVWSPNDLKDLSEMRPHDNGTFEISLPVISAATGTAPLGIRATLTAEIQGVGSTAMKRTIQLPPLLFRLKTDAALSAEARFFSEEGAPLGDGPLPPTVGQATRYRISWQIDKHVHALQDLRISAVLPDHVAFVRAATGTAGVLSYDDKTRSVIWTLNRLSADVNQAEMDFDIALTPTVTDDGRFASLLGDSSLQAVDEDIKETVVSAARALTTDLQNDAGAKGKGVVRKEVK